MHGGMAFCLGKAIHASAQQHFGERDTIREFEAQGAERSFWDSGSERLVLATMYV